MNVRKTRRGNFKIKSESRMKILGISDCLRHLVGKKNIAALTVASMVFQLTLSGAILSASAIKAPAASASENSTCDTKLDLMIVVDVTESMNDGAEQSRCQWWGSSWNMSYNTTQEWCDSKSQPPNRLSTYTPAKNSKIADTKSAISNFLDNFGENDRSGLVTFSSDASLSYSLSENISEVQASVNDLVAADNNGTNIGQAIEQATNELSENARDGAEKIIILLTDGKANRPNGTGSSQNDDDVNLSVENAQVAKDYGIKIHTIGLESEVNSGMLQSMASITDGDRYNAAESSELSEIYNTIYSNISTHTCEPSSISGCKYSDANGDGILADESKISGWEIILSGDGINEAQYTDDNGCYIFENLLEGDYQINEGTGNDGNFRQTYPENGTYVVSLTEGENAINNDFGNYLPICGNGIKDADFPSYVNEECDGNDGVGEHQSCSGDCKIVNLPYCGDNIKNQDEECDGSDGIGNNQTCSDECTIINLAFCGDNVLNEDEQCDGTEGIDENQSCSETCEIVNLPYCGDGEKNHETETCDDGNLNSGDGCSETCNMENQPSNPVCGNNTKEAEEQCDGSDGIGEHQSCSESCQIVNLPYCGDNIKNQEEECDGNDGIGNNQTCSENCEIVNLPYCGDGEKNHETETCDDGNLNSGDGCSETCNVEIVDNEETADAIIGGAVAPSFFSLSMPQESIRTSNLSENSVTITWLTTHFSTSRIIYSLEGENHNLDMNDNSGALPKYGYAHTTPEYDLDPKVTGHSVTISGLSPNTKYYYRTVSRGSFAISTEYEFTSKQSTGNSQKNNVVKNEESNIKEANCSYLNSFISPFLANDPEEVKKLEIFLNEKESEKLEINGVYDANDISAVNRFQMKYKAEILSPWNIASPTGNVYITTRNKINSLSCGKELPITATDMLSIKNRTLLSKNQILAAVKR